MAIGLRSRFGSAGTALLVAVVMAAGCSTTGQSPLASATPLEREFVMAAGTWDINRDGNVTCEEWKQYVTGLFREADANRDGILTREEFAVLSRRDRLFESVGMSYFDANADGRLTLAEITDKPNPAFTLLDKDGDCVLTSDERVQSRAENKGPSSRRRH